MIGQTATAQFILPQIRGTVSPELQNINNILMWSNSTIFKKLDNADSNSIEFDGFRNKNRI